MMKMRRMGIIMNNILILDKIENEADYLGYLLTKYCPDSKYDKKTTNWIPPKKEEICSTQSATSTDVLMN